MITSIEYTDETFIRKNLNITNIYVFTIFGELFR